MGAENRKPGYTTEDDFRHMSALFDECLAVTYGLRKSLLTKGKKL
jgi:hypothetical protein